jgi:hypothetical protein
MHFFERCLIGGTGHTDVTMFCGRGSNTEAGDGQGKEGLAVRFMTLLSCC